MAMPQIMYAHSLYTSFLGATLYLSIKIRFRHRKDTIGWPYCIQGFNILLYFLTEKSRHLYNAIAFWCFQVDRRIRFAVLVSMIEHLIFPSNHVFRTDLAYLLALEIKASRLVAKQRFIFFSLIPIQFS